MSSEEVYDELFKNVKKININQLIDKMIDEHMDGEGEEGDSDGDEGDQKGKGCPRLSPEEREKVRDEIKEAMMAAAQTCDAGNIPLGVKRLIQDLTEPKMNWRELLRMQIESTIKSDYTWMKASRKGWHVDAIMPGMKTAETIDIAIAIDTSGSISSEQARDFLSEIRGIMETFDNYRIHVFTFDTEVYNPQQYNSDTLEDIEEYDIQGGGGTAFEAIFDYLKGEDLEPKRLVVFTDGYPGGTWGDENYCDTVWIIHGDENPNPPFGTWALYKED
jgi:predicted metal-dependent peptidase